MSFDFITIPEKKHLRLQIEKYNHIMLKYRANIVELRIEKDNAFEK